MAKQYEYQLAVPVPPVQHTRPVEHGLGDWIGLLGAIVIMFGVPLFAAFVAWRFFRWFFRATR